MSVQEDLITRNENIFKKQMAAYGARDLDQLMSTFTDDVVLRDMANADNPYVGKTAAREFLAAYFSDLRNVKVTITSITANATDVVGEIDVTADWVSAPFSEEAPRRVRFRYGVADTIVEGQVADERFYWDSGDLARQLA